MCRVHLCNRKAVPNSNLCDGHYRQLVEKVLRGSTESEKRVLDGNR